MRGRAETGGIGVFDQGLEQDPEVVGQAGDGVGAEQVGVVFQVASEAAGGFGEAQGQVELGDGEVGGQGLDLEAGQVGVGAGGVLEDQEGLEQGGVVEGAFGFEFVDQAFEGEVLVGVGVQAGLLHALEQGGEGGVVLEAGAENQGVDEEADEALEFLAGAVGDGGAEGEVGLACVAGEEDGEGGGQGHEQGGAGGVGEGVEAGGEAGVEEQGVAAASEGLDGGAGEVGGEGEQGREAVELVAPVVDLGLEAVAGEPFALPGGEVGVLDGQGRERVGAAVEEGGIEGGGLADQDVDGPAVGDDVVEVGEQDVVEGIEPEEGEADQGAGGEVEAGAGMFAGQAARLGFALVGGQGAQVDEREVDSVAAG